MSACAKRKASSPANSVRSGRISCLRTSATSVARRRRASAGMSAASAPRWNVRPSTEACASTRARRARAGRCARPARPGCWAAASRVLARRATATSCSRNSGLPSAVSTIRPVVRSSRPPAASRRRPRGTAASRQRFERHHCGAAHDGRVVQQLRAREADQQDRRAAGEGREVLEQVEQRRLRPVDVLDDDDERARRRGHASNSRRTAQAISIGLRRLVGEADRAQHTAGDRAASSPPEELGDRRSGSLPRAGRRSRPAAGR